MELFNKWRNTLNEDTFEYDASDIDIESNDEPIIKKIEHIIRLGPTNINIHDLMDANLLLQQLSTN